MNRFACFAIALLSIVPPMPPSRSQAADGYTLAIEGTKARIGLYGIETPEKGQTFDDAAGGKA